jgi:hypothetical protein
MPALIGDGAGGCHPAASAENVTWRQRGERHNDGQWLYLLCASGAHKDQQERVS